MARDIYSCSKREKREHNEKILDQRMLKNIRANSKFCISMSDVKTLFRSPTPFIFIDCNNLLFIIIIITTNITINYLFNKPMLFHRRLTSGACKRGLQMKQPKVITRMVTWVEGNVPFQELPGCQ